ncbi:putative Helix-turn-helix transcriptional regulator [Hyphomicrobiales bacterium]|nr:putative Helix-turn-helix transcriptional regulator [Hyphomicrobiales bacterium]CAH1669582.1 putative Helix-turn-helix transcriptional regulator [Hyphomicrobiales bacterium]
MTLGDRVRKEREARGWTQPYLAELVGLDASTVNKIELGKSRVPRNFLRIAAALGMDEAEALRILNEARMQEEGVAPNDPPVMTRFRVKGSAKPLGAFGPLPQMPPQGNKTLPVLGYAAGGNTGSFRISDSTYDVVPCPPQLEHVSGAYAVFVYGESMEPRYFPGETVYVHPRLPVARGDFVVVQLSDEGESEPTEGIVKQYVGQGDEGLILHEFNPKSVDLPPVPLARVRAIHKIILAGSS